jgi:hypothetical protein
MFLLYVFASVQIYAQSPDQVSAQQYLEFVPARYRSALQEYLDLTGLSGTLNRNHIAHENSGIRRYQNQIGNSCFSSLSRELLRRESRVPYSDTSPNLNNLANNTENTDVQSGWYWDLANEVAGGDRNLAMMLVGVCGHDDAFCPSRGIRQGDPRYREGSLGDRTILNPQLRRRIVEIQAPNQGASSLPSKYYHVMGSAYMACALVRQGLPGPLVTMIQTRLAATYRMHRFCRPPGEQPNNFYRNVNEIQQLLSSGLTVDDLVQLTETRPGYDNNNMTRSILLINLYSQLHSTYNTQSAQQRRERILMMASFADAHQLLMTELMDGRTCSSPQLFGQNFRRMRRLALNTRFRCPGLSEERCSAAKSRLHTWWADAEWTIEQHRLGANFARRNCRYEPDFISNFEQRSCAALERLNQNDTAESSPETSP